MLKKYFPWEYAQSVFDIDYQKLWDIGKRGLIFDIDNTLVHHNADSTPQIDELIGKLNEMGFRILFITDNTKQRTESFIRNMQNVRYICDADKPSAAGYLKAMKMLGTTQRNTVVIGDQMIKDILGAFNSGIPSIMVHFVRTEGEVWYGWRRYIEFALLALWKHTRYYNRLGGIAINNKRGLLKTLKMLLKHEILFCDINSTCYKISVEKEVLKRHIHNLTHSQNYVSEKSRKCLPNTLYSYQAPLIKKGKGIDPVTQHNKADNIAIACKKLNGVVIHPNEVFSFWRVVGPSTKRRGYKGGRIIEGDKLIVGLGGGLCNLGNTMHLLALHSPLDVIEVHYHSDALAADHGKRVPLSSGTSVSYNYMDLRFENNTDQDFQILAWVKNDTLYAQLRSEKDIPYRYEITEEDHHFSNENGKFYRVSKIYRDTTDKHSGELIEHKLIRDNHSAVMFPYEEIPVELVR